jgi:hypothetical protein
MRIFYGAFLYLLIKNPEYFPAAGNGNPPPSGKIPNAMQQCHARLYYYRGTGDILGSLRIIPRTPF